MNTASGPLRPTVELVSIMHILVLLSAVVACAAGDPLNSTKPTPENRIVGGSTADITKFPYQLSLQKNGKHVCGAVLISQIWALTAAHCVDGVPTNNLTVIAGRTNPNCGRVKHLEVIYVEKHSSYVNGTVKDDKRVPYDFDIAVLRLKVPLNISNMIKTIALQETEVPDNTSATVTGWGDTKPGGSFSTSLRQVTVRTMNIALCSEKYPNKITHNMICAAAGGKDSCQGDSGGPLVANNTLIGLVSWGDGCAVNDKPGVYTNIFELRDWIRRKSGV